MKKIVWLFGVLLFVWLIMLLELWLILQVILPITVAADGFFGTLLTGIVRVGASVASAIMWLWLWRSIEYALFWKIFKAYKKKV